MPTNFESPTDAGEDNVYEVVVMPCDDETQNAGHTVAVTVTVTDVNDSPQYTANTITLRVPESASRWRSLWKVAVAAHDDEGDTLAYSLGGQDSSSFTIDPATAQIKTAVELDYETRTMYSVVVKASDTSCRRPTISDPVCQTATLDVAIEVTDVSEPPFLTDPAGPCDRNSLGSVRWGHQRQHQHVRTDERRR